MTAISDKHETLLTFSSGNVSMFYDDVGFLSAWVLVLDFILETFKGLSLLQSESETRGRDSVT